MSDKLPSGQLLSGKGVNSEAATIAAVDRPGTVGTLTADLQRLGVTDAAVVLVHSSMSAIGWVAGGAQAVVDALLGAVGESGTLVMPTQSGQLTDPAQWKNPPVPESWVQTIRDERPLYDARTTPTRFMGQVVECFRHYPGTIRSSHPTLSCAAHGPAAASLVDGHALTPAFGESSPLARLYDLDALVLLLGVGHGNNTSLHLAEFRADLRRRPTRTDGHAVVVDGARRWEHYDDFDYDESDFDQVGDAFAKSGAETHGTVGMAPARLCRQRDIVDFGVRWFEEHRA